VYNFFFVIGINLNNINLFRSIADTNLFSLKV